MVAAAARRHARVRRRSPAPGGVRMTESRPEVSNPVLVAPALVGVAIDISWRIGRWSTGTAVRAGRRVVRGAMSGESPARLVDATQAELRAYLRGLLGAGGGDGVEAPAAAGAAAANGSAPDGRAELRALGDDLLRRSAEVDAAEELHPAYARILSDVAPD